MLFHKRENEMKFPGRPPVYPREKLSATIRAMVTPPVYDTLEAVWRAQNISQSDFVRLAVYRLAQHYGFELPADDPTFTELREKGLI